MHKKLWLCLALLLVIPGLLFTTSCAKKTVKTEPAAMGEDAAKKAEAEAARQAELERQRKLEEERLKAEQMQTEAARLKGEGAKVRFEQENIYFDFDKSSLKMDAQEILKKKAAFLKANPNYSVLIEGNCDERGTDEYNLALGDRRANSAKKFLVNLGIAESRIKTISYGEERPLDPGHNEAAWAKNRNCQFKLQ
jgi:peptidoglycan-associated lipoprotein